MINVDIVRPRHVLNVVIFTVVDLPIWRPTCMFLSAFPAHRSCSERSILVIDSDRPSPKRNYRRANTSNPPEASESHLAPAGPPLQHRLHSLHRATDR
jgi:hypothetical protein